MASVQFSFYLGLYLISLNVFAVFFVEVLQSFVNFRPLYLIIFENNANGIFHFIF